VSEMVERVAWAIVAKMSEQTGRPPPSDTALSEKACAVARAAIEAMRDPIVIEQACRAAADPRTGYICWEGISVHRAADVVDAVLGAALLPDPDKPAKAVGELL